MKKINFIGNIVFMPKNIRSFIYHGYGHHHSAYCYRRQKYITIRQIMRKQ